LVTGIDAGRSEVAVRWQPVEVSLRPNPAGRRYWSGRPFFQFAANVAERYMLADLFAEHVPELPRAPATGPTPVQRVSVSTAQPMAPTPGYVYVLKSPHGYKIGKTVNLKDRIRLFSVKLPFETSLEHYAWFPDYTAAERAFHQRFHDRRLEGEWFDLRPQDLAEIRRQGKPVDVAGL
jgi:hypothetical protein